MEMGRFRQTSPEASQFEQSWLERLEARLEHAGNLGEAAAAEREILAIARSAIDSGPSNQTAMPSFYMTLDTVQRMGKTRSV